MLSMVLVVQRRGAASRSSLDHPAGGAEPRETQHTTRGAGLAGEGTVALAFPAARRAMRQPLPVQNEGIYPPHASVRLGMLRLGSVRMRGRKVGRVRSERWARKSASESKRVRAVIPAWVSRHCNPDGNGRARSGTRAKGRRRARNGLAECTRRRCSGYARFGRVDVLVVRRRGLSLKVSFGCHVAKCKISFGSLDGEARRRLSRDDSGAKTRSERRGERLKDARWVRCARSSVRRVMRRHTSQSPHTATPGWQKVGNTGADSTCSGRME